MPRQAHALERINGPARFVLKRRERPRSSRHRQLVDARGAIRVPDLGRESILLLERT